MLKFSQIVLLLAFGALISACSQTEPPKTKGSPDGAELFKSNCVICHGADGKLGLNGAGDLSKSTLDKNARIELVTNGKNAMTPFKALLSPEEIEAVAEYTFSLKSVEE